MSKMIYREPNGNWGVKGVPWAEIPDGLYGALYKLKDYEEACDSPRLVASFMDGGLGPVRYRLIDEAHSVWQCENCSHIAQFEANGPISNGWAVCPCCARMIADDTEAVLDEEDHEELCNLILGALRIRGSGDNRTVSITDVEDALHVVETAREWFS